MFRISKYGILTDQYRGTVPIRQILIMNPDPEGILITDPGPTSAFLWSLKKYFVNGIGTRQIIHFLLIKINSEHYFKISYLR